MASKHFVEPARPTAPSLLNRIMRGIIFTIVSVIGIPIIAFVAIRNWNAFYLNISSAFKPSIRLNAMFKDQELEQKIWQTEIGQLYCENLEYQKQEGYCAPTTVRVILKSISEIPTSSYPEMKSGGSIPEQIVQKIDSTGYTASQIIHGSDGFESFLKTIRLSNNPKYRISANFLRSSLFGFSKPIFLPHNILLGLFGGHFSPIVGYDEEANMVLNMHEM